MLVHHGSGNGEMERRCAAIAQWPRIQFRFNRWRVIDDLQMRPRCEPGKVARMLWRRRMMQKFGWESFHNSIHIVHAKLALIDEEPISWRCAFEERHGSFD